MSRILALVLCLTIAAAPPQWKQPGGGIATLAPDTETRWVPFDLTPGNQIRFTATVDGRSATAVLDTGVSISLLARESPLAIGSRIRAGGSATAIGGAVPIGWMATRQIAFGGLVRTGGGVNVADLPAIATGGKTSVDLLVGRDLLAPHALDIDYANRRFRLLPSGRLPFTGSVAPLSISPDLRIYQSALTLAGKTLAPVVVDTGDGSAVTVTEAGWRRAPFQQLPTTTAISFGLGGAVISRLAIVPTLGLGALQAHQVEVRIEPADGFSQSIRAAGRIGSGFLENYRVLLDPGAGRMVFQPGPGANRPPLRSTSGLLLGVEPDRLKVLHVMAGGPAASGGWKAGDAICSVDGQLVPADYQTNSMASWSVKPAGTVVRLGLCDGTTRELTLRDFY